MAIVYLEGAWGLAYIEGGIIVALLDWMLWRKPVLILTARPMIRFVPAVLTQIMPELAHFDEENWLDGAHEDVMTMHTAKARHRCMVMIPLLALPWGWISLLRVLAVLVAPNSTLVDKWRQISYNREITRMLNDKDLWRYAAARIRGEA